MQNQRKQYNEVTCAHHPTSIINPLTANCASFTAPTIWIISQTNTRHHKILPLNISKGIEKLSENIAKIIIISVINKNSLISSDIEFTFP